MGAWIAGYFALLVGGVLIGLIPLVLGRVMGKPNLGLLGLICCAVSAAIHISLPIVVAIGFSVAVFLVKTDIRLGQGRSAVPPSPDPAGPAHTSAAGQGANLALTCLSGPMRGQTYRIGSGGLLFGRDNDCSIRFSADTPGISRHHCCIRWQQGFPVLVDLNSSYGTFMGDGRQLPPNYPTRLAAGSRFYLGSPEILFQITLI